jgi:hypothetical protein
MFLEEKPGAVPIRMTRTSSALNMLSNTLFVLTTTMSPSLIGISLAHLRLGDATTANAEISRRYGARILSTTVHYISCIKIGD